MNINILFVCLTWVLRITLKIKLKLKINKYGMYVKLVLGLHSLQVQ